MQTAKLISHYSKVDVSIIEFPIGNINFDVVDSNFPVWYSNVAMIDISVHVVDRKFWVANSNADGSSSLFDEFHLAGDVTGEFD
ncbi:hypothetical protein DLK05_06975 [Ancylomarina longa]|uniref:Uncharacterized protein n=1 Tax=Ancylomarina longa TaxID=2487017 RepID=A0A434AVQ1_9BACT|nr:hypothetical protein DLK05_06975 [Ancylomarina longa]